MSEQKVFSKKTAVSEVTINVTHALYPGVQFAFPFHKRLPQAALDAGETLQGLTDKERLEEWRKQFIAMIAAALVREPEGFDFPQDSRPLAERMREYFDDPDFPELQEILFNAWGAYKAAVSPAAYLKSSGDSGA